MSSDAVTSKADSNFPASEWRPSLAEALVACVGIRDLMRLRKHYPSAMTAGDAEELRAALAGHLESLLANGDLGFVRPHLAAFKVNLSSLKLTIQALENKRSALELDVAMTTVFHSLLPKVPGLPLRGSDPWYPREAIDRAIAACQERIGPRMRELSQQLVDVKLYDCRIPVGDPTFDDPRRSVQMVREYWAIASSLVLHQMDAQVSIQPHPLLRLIVGLRARIDGYLERLGEHADIREARDSAAYLLEAVSGGDPDELSVVPESTQQRVHVVNRLVEDLRLKAGSRVFPLTPEEEMFLSHAKSSVAQHHLAVEKAWRRMVGTAAAAAKPWTGPGVAPTPVPHGGPAVPTAVTRSPDRPEEGHIHQDQPAPMSASAAVDRRGQPCLGLPPSAIRVIRAYKDWESRRAGRRGLPTPPTVDDLEAQTGLARATVIRARKALLRESLLEQIPDAVDGKLRLTPRGLTLELPA